MTKQNPTPHILVISRTEDDQAYLEDFFERTPLPKPDFVIGKFVPSDKYDFLVFNSRNLPIYKAENVIALSDDEQKFLYLLDRYISDTNKYIVFFGAYYYNLNYERCQAANSKFSLYARLREMIDFIGNYRQ
jgi:hypothetical protein